MSETPSDDDEAPVRTTRSARLQKKQDNKMKKEKRRNESSWIFESHKR